MFAAVQRMRKLEEATNGKDEPTPGEPSTPARKLSFPLHFSRLPGDLPSLQFAV